MRIVLLFRFDHGADSSGVLREVEELAPLFLPPRFGAAPRCSRWSSKDKKLALLVWESAHHPRATEIAVQPDLAFTYTGYVTEQNHSAAQLLPYVRSSFDAPLSKHPGGMAAFFCADEASGRCWAWASEPQLENVFLAVQPKYLVVGNRPLAVHLAASRERRIAVDSLWARELVAGAMAVSHRTPFVGTSYVPARTTAVLASKGVTLVPHAADPIELPSSRQKQEQLYADELLRAIGVLAHLPRAELRLSGGKDSRLLAAAARRMHLPVLAHTLGEPTHWESPLAAEVAQVTGLEHCFGQPAFVGPDALRAAAQEKIRAANGMISEGRHLGFQTPEPLGPHAPVVFGHAHHLRGGFKTRLSLLTRNAARSRLFLTMTRYRDFVERSLLDEMQGQVAGFVSSTPVREPGELFYRLYNDFRVARWVAASYLENAGHRLPVFPLCDQRVVRVCSALDYHHRASERAQYGVLRELSVRLADMPLFNSRWRFDERHRLLRQFTPGYWRRRPIEPPPDPPGTARVAPERRVHVVGPEICEVVTQGKARALLEDALPPSIWRLLEERDFDGMNRVTNRALFVEFLWRLYGLALVLEADWLEQRVTVDTPLVSSVAV